MGNMPSLTQIQLCKYKECLIHVNNDLGMLLQNAENLAYKLGVLKKEEFHYKSYDYYNQYEEKNILTLRKNILSSLNFLKKQFIAIKLETGKEYIFPPSIEQVKNDVKHWKKLVEKKSPEDIKYYDAIISIIDNRKYTEIEGWEEVYDKCNNNKGSDVSPYMWMNFSPPILNNIDNNVENIYLKNQMNPNFNPDLNRDGKENTDPKLFRANEINKDTKYINKLLKECRDYEFIKKRIVEFMDNYKCEPYIDEQNIKFYKIIYNSIINDVK